MTKANQIDVIVRFHDVARISELERCIFSLVGQDYRPLHIILAVQRFSEADIELTRSRLAALLSHEQAPEFEILNWEHETPADARSALINMGIRVAKGRYVAFLDYDDVLYPEAYGMLVSQLRLSGADIAFAKVRSVALEVHSSFLRPISGLLDFQGASLRDLFRANFCPIHSYLIDRTRIPEQFLFFEPNLFMEEDYDFLLRVCATFKSDFSLIETAIGEYYFKTDSSNTHANAVRSVAWQASYERASGFVEQRRCNTMLSTEVQLELGLPHPRGELSIRAFLNE